MNMVSNSYNGHLDFSTNGTNYNRTDTRSLSVASAQIISSNQKFLLNDTTLHISFEVVQDPNVMLIKQDYGVFLSQLMIRFLPFLILPRGCYEHIFRSIS